MVGTHVPGTCWLDLFLFTYPVCACPPKRRLCSLSFVPRGSLLPSQYWFLGIPSSFTQQTFTKHIFNPQHCTVVLRSKDCMVPVKFSVFWEMLYLTGVFIICGVLSDSDHQMDFVKTSFPLSLNASGSHLVLPELLFCFSSSLLTFSSLFHSFIFHLVSFHFKVDCQIEFYSMTMHLFAWSKFNPCVAFYSRQNRLIWSII